MDVVAATPLWVREGTQVVLTVSRTSQEPASFRGAWRGLACPGRRL